jgi:hypothetical protein
MIRSILLCAALSGRLLYAQTASENPNPLLAFQQNLTPNSPQSGALDTNSMELSRQKIKYLQLGAENDVWVTRQGTDRYYTHGFLIDYSFSKNGLTIFIEKRNVFAQQYVAKCLELGY